MYIQRKIQDSHDPGSAPKLNLQEESKHGLNKLISIVKSKLQDGPKAQMGPSNTMKVARGLPRAGLKSSMQNNNITFQEEYELLQRKYLRQVTSFATEGYYPRLVVLDFADERKEGKTHFYISIFFFPWFYIHLPELKAEPKLDFGNVHNVH